MAAVDRNQSLAEVVQRGREIFERDITPKLLPSDHGKFVAIDVLTSEYEIDEDDCQAVMKLRARLPDSKSFLARAGFKTTFKLSFRQTYGRLFS